MSNSDYTIIKMQNLIMASKDLNSLIILYKHRKREANREVEVANVQNGKK
jgi:hypothetical protein